MSDSVKNKYLREEYISRINRVIDFIEKNLENELQLEQLAGVANFSSFHFHRIFSSIVNEPLNQFIQRLRLEKAASQLISNPKKTITRVAYDCGFGSSSSFARAFKEYYSVSPSKWKELKNNENSKISINESKNSKTSSNIGKELSNSHVYIDSKSHIILRRNAMNSKQTTKDPITIEVKDLQEMNVAYVRHIGPYKGDEALFNNLFEKLFSWAGARNLCNFPETKVLSIYHDNPEITEESKLRTSVCITVPEGTKVDGEIGKMLVKGGKYVVANFELAADEFEAAWNYVYGQWLPESGYQPDDRPNLEFCLNDADKHPEKKFIVDICVAVKPL